MFFKFIKSFAYGQFNSRHKGQAQHIQGWYLSDIAVLERGSQYTTVGTAPNGQAHSRRRIIATNNTKFISQVNMAETPRITFSITASIDNQLLNHFLV